MKFQMALPVLVMAVGLAGCATNRDGRVTNPRAPGPAVGNAVGAVGGTVVGNVAGAVVGVGEGAVTAAAVPFNNDRRVVRRWETVTTSDGRTVRVPVEVEVDEYGIPYADRAAATGGGDERSVERGPRR